MTINPEQERTQEEQSATDLSSTVSVSFESLLIDEDLPTGNVVIGIGAQRIWDTAERINQCSQIIFSSSQVLNELPSLSTLLTLLHHNTDPNSSTSVPTPVPDYECSKSLGNIFKQKSIELSSSRFSSHEHNQHDREGKENGKVNKTIASDLDMSCLFLQYAGEFYRYRDPRDMPFLGSLPP
jgi:hypothetical protein